LGSASGDGLLLQKFELSAGKNEKVQLMQPGNNCHKRFLTEVSVNGGVAFET